MSISKVTEKKWKIYEGNNADAGWGLRKPKAYADTKAEAVKFGKAHFNKFTIGAVRKWYDRGNEEWSYSDTVYYYERNPDNKRSWVIYDYWR